MTIISTTPTATAHLLMYEAGDAAIPTTAAEALLALAGATVTSAGMP